MNCLAIVCVIVCFANITNAKTENTINEDKYPIINSLIVKVKESVWSEDEKICVKDTLEMLYGVKNRTLWATWAWDSMQPPVGVFYGCDYHLGNFDQCMKAPWPNSILQYCLVDVDIGDPEPSREIEPFGDAEDYLKRITNYGRPLNKQTFGVCLPSSCRPASTGKVYGLLHQLTYLIEGNVTVNPRDCQVASEARPKTIKFLVFWGTIAALIIAVAISNFKSFFGKYPKGLIAKSFSFKINFRELIKASDGDIKAMNGIRFLTAAIVVTMHETCVSFALPIINAMDTGPMTTSGHGKILLHSDILVDTFFVMSGLLVAKSLFSDPNKNLIITLLKRYIRLIGPYALITFYLISSVYETGDGPVWFRMMSKEAEPCEKYWWKNFLMINNDITTVCHMVSWYIPCDYQLAVLTTFIFFLYRKNNKLGLSVFLATGTAFTIKYGWIIYANNLSILPFENPLVFSNIREHVILNEIYFNFGSRIASYFVGVLMGYILVIYKPTHYRVSIGKAMSAVILLSSVTILLFILCVGYLYSFKSYNALEAAVIVALHKGVWAVAICGIIAVAEYGTPNYVTEFLELPVFRPLSKLSYSIYLTHMIFIQRNFASTRSPIKHGFYTITINSMGILNVSCVASFIIYFIIEAPLIRISNELFNKKKRDVKTNEMRINNLQNGKSKKL